MALVIIYAVLSHFDFVAKFTVKNLNKDFTNTGRGRGVTILWKFFIKFFKVWLPLTLKFVSTIIDAFPVSFLDAFPKAVQLQVSCVQVDGLPDHPSEFSAEAQYCELYHEGCMCMFGCFRKTLFPKNIARGTTDPGYWLFNLSYLSS